MRGNRTIQSFGCRIFWGAKDRDGNDFRRQRRGPRRQCSSCNTVDYNGNRIESRDLFALEREIIIVHGEDIYRMRLTSQNKLILTK